MGIKNYMLATNCVRKLFDHYLDPHHIIIMDFSNCREYEKRKA